MHCGARIGLGRVLLCSAPGRFTLCMRSMFSKEHETRMWRLLPREHVERVLLSLEDELAAMDVQHAELLRRAHQQREQAGDGGDSGGDREATAQATARLLGTMQRKGQQIQQLRRYTVRCEA